MGRPREFDPEQAISGAMAIFWRQGYKATNLPDLLQAMGLTRGSFYKAFQDKETVYLRALDHYDQTVISKTVARLAECDAGAAFDCLAMLFTAPTDRRLGCFICNAMVERAPHSADVATKANAMAERLRRAIQDVILRADPKTTRAAELSDLILHLYFGHQAIGKSADTSQDWPTHLKRLLG